MKIIVQDNKGNNIYERSATLCELEKVLSCKDCKYFIQHYSITNSPDNKCITCCKNGKTMFVTELNCGHCFGFRGVKSAKPDGRICQNFALRSE